jgi:hypothetical protein
MLNYIINCNNTKYNSISQINDIRYLNSTDKDIQKIINNSDAPSSKILEIVQILKKNKHT